MSAVKLAEGAVARVLLLPSEAMQQRLHICYASEQQFPGSDGILLEMYFEGRWALPQMKSDTLEEELPRDKFQQGTQAALVHTPEISKWY